MLLAEALLTEGWGMLEHGLEVVEVEKNREGLLEVLAELSECRDYEEVYLESCSDNFFFVHFSHEGVHC